MSGKDISDQKIDKLNEIIRKEKACPDNCELSPKDKILIIPNKLSVINDGEQAVCVDIRMSTDEPESKAADIVRILKAHLLLSSKTDLIIMSGT